MNALDVVLVGLVVAVLVFGDRLRGMASRLKYKLKALRPSNRLDYVDKVLGDIQQNLYVRQDNAKRLGAELDYIKGQFQEMMHKQQDTGAFQASSHAAVLEQLALIKLELVAQASVRGSIDELNRRLSNGGEDINTIYLQSLAVLTKSSDATLERQEKIEGLLVQLVGQLNRLTNT